MMYTHLEVRRRSRLCTIARYDQVQHRHLKASLSSLRARTTISVSPDLELDCTLRSVGGQSRQTACAFAQPEQGVKTTRIQSRANMRDADSSRGQPETNTSVPAKKYATKRPDTFSSPHLFHAVAELGIQTRHGVEERVGKDGRRSAHIDLGRIQRRQCERERTDELGQSRRHDDRRQTMPEDSEIGGAREREIVNESQSDATSCQD